eukprot:CAMPEP_0194200236 /NCGR_PEP_ID=MMETSP0156-20130528/930_1 /TAXON_ID=33649 /ORGANISM="Thalassionema nitzschioides, Strain L26-B" /LENGTH=1934 /DNA_ID=CAMNT_0038925209 /DNA_START=189 /DNA_END=5989 /DNA_ORIENTATION=-
MKCASSRRFPGLISAFISLLLLTLYPASAYQAWEEGNYLNNFDQLEANSYSVVNDPNVAPVGLPAECQITNTTHLGDYFDGNTVALTTDGSFDPINPTLETISAASAQAQCGTSSICVVPRGLRLIMSSNLNVYSLIVQGELYWRDIDQVNVDQYLCGGVIVAEGEAGRFIMNLSKGQKRGWIYVKDNGAHYSHGKTRFFGGIGEYGISGPLVEITGRKLTRTWSLLAKAFKANEMSIKLMHSPVRMGWQVGDRIGISSTQKGSDGTAHSFTITDLDDDGTVNLDSTFTNNGLHRTVWFLKPEQAVDDPETQSAALMTAEVINLSRNIIITGDDLRHVPCNTPNVGCGCGDHKSTCTLGLHTAQMHTGKMSIRNVRVEKCGQRGVTGTYCLHFHRLEDCPDCEFSGNAIEHGHHRGIIVHGTHRSTIENNVLYDIRGAGIYIEDGNEVANQIKYNVVICPWPLINGVLRGCTVPGTDNAEADTPLNQAGIYTSTAANDIIGNRVCNSFNGLLLQASGSGRGDAYGMVCTNHLEFGRWEGNTFHGHSRFGLYSLGGSFPRDTDQSIATNGFNTDQAETCKGFNNEGDDRGKPVSILNNVDWHAIFVGHYNAGDMQHRGHTSISNNNLIYWKETKNFADGCAAHISDSYYTNGNMALPDDSTFIMERTTFKGYVVLEANHHCNVGVTGHLCMPSYIFDNVLWIGNPAPTWMWLQRGGTGGGGIFSLSPPNAQAVMSASPQEQAEYEFGKMFPPGYVTVASKHYTYLLSTPWCISSGTIGLGTRYTDGILCRKELRVVKLWSSNSPNVSLKVEVWMDNTLPGTSEQDTRAPDITQHVNFHQIGGLGKTKQGYSLPVFVMEDDVSYRLSLDNGNATDIPSDWVIEFSDAVMGNRWAEEFVNLHVVGRVCENNGVISSQHSRRFMGGAPDHHAWGSHGACVNSNPPPKMEPVDCIATADTRKLGTISATSCPEKCSPECNSANSYCHCEFGCLCKAGFTGANCTIDICSMARCGEHGICSARYLGDTSILPPSNQACVCDQGWYGPLCDKQDAVNLARIDGVTATQSSVCENGPAWKAIDGNTNQQWGGGSIMHTCDNENHWWMVDLVLEQPISYVIVWNRLDCCSDRLNDSELQILDSNQVVVSSQPVVNSLSTNHIYFENTVGRYVRLLKTGSSVLNIAEVQVFAEAKCDSCSNEFSDCELSPPCNVDGSCPTSGSALFAENGTPCNSKPMGTCQDGQCAEPETIAPSYEPTPSPITFAPTLYDVAERVELVTGSAVATQSSVCEGGVPQRAIDGDTNGNWYHGSVQHTCGESNPWWKVDLDKSYNYVISRVKVYNRNDCCNDRFTNSELQILDDNGEVMGSQAFVGNLGVFEFIFDAVAGSSVRVWKNGSGTLNIAEVQVLGWQLSKSPTKSPTLLPTTTVPTGKPTMSPKPTMAPIATNAPTGELINLALVSGVEASQSTTYMGQGAGKAIDGVKTDGSSNAPSTHTECNYPMPWWRAQIGLSIVHTVKVYNRNDCCWVRLANFTVSVLDKDLNVITSENYPGTAPRYEAVTVDFSAAMPRGEYVEVKLGGTNCLSLSEVEIFGYEILPPAFSLVSDESVASQSTTCHGGGANRAIDGNTNGNYYANSVTHTCPEMNPWWKVDLAPSYNYTISRVYVHNRNDCCVDTLIDSELQILDDSGNVLASQPFVGVKGAYQFEFDDVTGSSVRVQKNGSGVFTLAEVRVLGHSYKNGVISPPPINLARRPGITQPATQSSTCEGGLPGHAKDGNTNQNWGGGSIAHTCKNGELAWWQVDLGAGETYVIAKVLIYNRMDCCTGRNSNSELEILDDEMNVVDSRSILTGDTSPIHTLDFGNVSGGRYVRLRKNTSGVMNIAEVQVKGWLGQNDLAPPTDTPTSPSTDQPTNPPASSASPTPSPTTTAPTGKPTMSPKPTMAP